MEAEIGRRFRHDMSMLDIIDTATAGSPVNQHGTECAKVIDLGHGTLSWPRFERHTDRYGTVFLCTGPNAEGFVSFESAPVGSRGHLVAVVLDTRPSVHCGDFARDMVASTQAVGEVITLGSDTGLSTAVGLTPGDGRDEDWLDPRALYRCHSQTVRLELRVARHTGYRRSDTRRVA